MQLQGVKSLVWKLAQKCLLQLQLLNLFVTRRLVTNHIAYVKIALRTSVCFAFFYLIISIRIFLSLNLIQHKAKHSAKIY